MNPRSSSLFHFTKTNDTLYKILEGGFWPRYCLEDVTWHGIDQRDYVAFPMVCFCDIPLSRIDEHVQFYGRFGIGLTKEWGERNGLNPIMYISENHEIVKSLRQLVGNLAHLSGAQKEKGFKNVRHIFAHSKPITGRMIVDDVPKSKNFYQESEWRYVPKGNSFKGFMNRKDHGDKNKLNDANQFTYEKFKLEFEPKDVRHIFVSNDTEVSALVDFIQSNMDNYPASDLKLLTTRITSLESLTNDL